MTMRELGKSCAAEKYGCELVLTLNTWDGMFDTFFLSRTEGQGYILYNKSVSDSWNFSVFLQVLRGKLAQDHDDQPRPRNRCLPPIKHSEKRWSMAYSQNHCVLGLLSKMEKIKLRTDDFLRFLILIFRQHFRRLEIVRSTGCWYRYRIISNITWRSTYSTSYLL